MYFRGQEAFWAPCSCRKVGLSQVRGRCAPGALACLTSDSSALLAAPQSCALVLPPSDSRASISVMEVPALGGGRSALSTAQHDGIMARPLQYMPLDAVQVGTRGRSTSAGSAPLFETGAAKV